MRNPRLNQANGTWRTGNFGVTMGQFATVLFLTLPCAAQNPPGVLYSTTLPGAGTPEVDAVTVDSSDNAYVVGHIWSGGLEGTPGTLQPSYSGGTCVLSGSPTPTGCAEPFIAKFNSTGALVFLTYLGGGTGYDIADAVAVDASGNIYVGGTTTSTDFPLAGSPWRPTLPPGTLFTFLAKISGDGSKLIWSTVIVGGPVVLALTSSRKPGCFDRKSSSQHNSHAVDQRRTIRYQRQRAGRLERSRHWNGRLGVHRWNHRIGRHS
jgi:hypothetical protein